MLRNIELQRKGRLYTSVGELGTTPLSTIWSNSGHLPPGAQLQSLGITTPPGCRTDNVNKFVYIRPKTFHCYVMGILFL